MLQKIKNKKKKKNTSDKLYNAAVQWESSFLPD